MGFNIDIGQLIAQASRFLEVPMTQLTQRRPVIEELLTFFAEGKPDLSARQAGHPEFPRFVRRGIIAVLEQNLAVATVQRIESPFLSSVSEAVISFDVLADPNEQEPRWVELASAERYRPLGVVVHTFTSALPLRRNLEELARIVTSERPTVHLPAGTPTAEDWLATSRLPR